MTETKPWTEYEDKILKFIRDEEGVQKWSTIAQKMAQQYGLKGRNGKQCKQRYMEVFDENKQVLHWDYETEQLMFLWHDKLGNKWAAIGQQLNNRTDNDVKNHFYSKIRKGLRKINYLIKDHLKKQFKQIKQTILYKIIEGAEDRFSPNPIHNEEVWNFCIEAKNCLLRMSYDQKEYNAWNEFAGNEAQIRCFFQHLTVFSKNFHRNHPKLEKRKENMREGEKMENMKTEYRISSRINGNNNSHSGCDSEMQSSQIEESHQPQKSSQQQVQSQQKLLFPQLLGSPFHYTLNSDSPKKLQKINQVIILKSSSQLKEMQSEMSSGQLKRRQTQEMNINIMGPSLLPSIPKLIHISSKANAMIDQEDEDIRMADDIEGELMKDGLLEEDQEKGEKLWGNGSKKIASKDSNFSSYSIDEEEGPFFGEDSTLNMRIFTTGVGGKMTNQMTGSIQKSDMLFKSVGSGKLFESMESQGKRDFQMSIERSGQLSKHNSLFQSVGR